MDKIKTALLSVYDKNGLLELAKFLEKGGVKIISTGGTFQLLIKNGIEATEISEHTGFPEMMNGRLKTLHPKIHGGLLGRKEDAEIMKSHDMTKIDLVVVNLYPFEETVLNSKTFEEIIEKIDIGGPSMVRSAAKNFETTTIITDIKDYSGLQDELEKNNFGTTIEFRKSKAAKAFSLTAFYDSVISKWFMSQVSDENTAEVSTLPMRKIMGLRYGENPHQKAEVFEIPLSAESLLKAKKLQGKELSYNNICDMQVAFEITSSFEKPAISVIKHNNPCGIALDESIENAYIKALKTDPRSAFGGIVSSNREITKELALLIKENFYEVIIAPHFSKEALEILSKKTNLRLLELPLFKSTEGKMFKNVKGGILVQDTDSAEITSENLKLVSGVEDSFKMEDAIFSFKTVKFYKSNAIVITSGTRIVSFGCGQTSRIDSMEIACKKLALSGVDPKSCIMSSDAFFPFTDNLEMAYNAGIRTIIAPSGSVKDEEVKEYAKKMGINLLFANTRHFNH